MARRGGAPSVCNREPREQEMSGGAWSARGGEGDGSPGCLVISALAVGAPAAAGSHPGTTPADELGLTEQELRQAETEALGAAHAAEHAQQRALLRQQGELGPAITPRVADEGPAARVAGPPSQVGQWGAPFPIPIFGIAALMLPTGKVMWWAYPLRRREDARQHGRGVALGPGDRDLKAG